MRPSIGILLSVVLSSACGGGAPTPDGGHEGDSSPGPIDGGASDAGGFEDAGRTAPQVSFTLPSEGTVRVNGEVRLQLVVRNANEDDEVEIWKDDGILAILPPPYTYTWDSQADSEGAHVLAAVVRRDGEELARAERELIVDRSPPTIIERSPDMDGRALWTDVIRIRFSEPVVLDPTTDVTLHLDGTLTDFTVEQPEPDTLLLTPATTPESLPATATITVGRAVRDTVGFELGSDIVWSFQYPGWAPRTSGPPGCRAVHDVEVDSTDRLWLLYVTSTDPGSWQLQLASWDGAAWTVLPSPRAAVNGITQAELSIGPSDEVAVAWTAWATTTVREAGLRIFDGTRWAELPGLERAGDFASAVDLVHQGDGALVFSRRINRDYVVHRHDGAWSQVGVTQTSFSGSAAMPDLLWTASEGLRAVWGAGNACWTGVESGTGWVDMREIAGPVSSPGCSRVTLFEPGGVAFTPTIYAFVDSGGSAQIRHLTGGGLPTIEIYPRSWLHVISSPTGFLALGAMRTGTIQLVTEANTQIVVDDPDAVRVAFVAGEALVINESGAVLAPNRLTP